LGCLCHLALLHLRWCIDESGGKNIHWKILSWLSSISARPLMFLSRHHRQSHPYRASTVTNSHTYKDFLRSQSLQLCRCLCKPAPRKSLFLLDTVSWIVKRQTENRERKRRFLGQKHPKWRKFSSKTLKRQLP
jgi:hypothetical protein